MFEKFDTIFGSIKNIRTPIALIAFIVAIIAFSYAYTINGQRKLIETAPEAERAKLVEDTVRDFTKIDTDGLTQDQKYKLAIRTIQTREYIFGMTAILAVIIALIILFAWRSSGCSFEVYAGFHSQALVIFVIFALMSTFYWWLHDQRFLSAIPPGDERWPHPAIFVLMALVPVFCCIQAFLLHAFPSCIELTIL